MNVAWSEVRSYHLIFMLIKRQTTGQKKCFLINVDQVRKISSKNDLLVIYEKVYEKDKFPTKMF